MSHSETVAVLGAGSTMGSAMAENIATAGIGVRAWNRTREKAEPLASKGAAVCDSPAEAVKDAGVMLTMLADADAVLDCAADALSGAAGDVIWLQMSTIGEEGTTRCMELAESHGVTFVDAPVLGTKQPAAEGKLIVLASGPESERARLQTIFDAVSQRTIWVGDAGAGTRLKLATNMWVLTVVEGVAETIAFTEGLGLDPSLLFEAISGGPLDLPYAQLKGKAIRERNFDPQFSLRLAAKDAGLMEDAAAARDLDLPLLHAIRERLDQGAREHGDEDLSATYLTSAPA